MTIEKAIAQCKNLTPVEATIAKFICSRPDEVIHMTIQDISEQLHISKSAVLRFCKKIGFNGFNELKVQLAQEMNEKIRSNHMINVNFPFSIYDSSKEIANKLIELYTITIQDTCSCIDYSVLQTIAKLLNDAEVIDIYAHAHNFHIAQNFKDKMLTIGKRVNCIENFYDQRLNVLTSDSRHVAIILSYSGKASWILTILQKLKEKNIPVIQIGKINSNHYPALVSYHLGISNLENLRDRISQFSSHIAMQYMMDVLYSCIFRIDWQKNRAFVEQFIDYMDDREP